MASAGPASSTPAAGCSSSQPAGLQQLDQLDRDPTNLPVFHSRASASGSEAATSGPSTRPRNGAAAPQPVFSGDAGRPWHGTQHCPVAVEDPESQEAALMSLLHKELLSSDTRHSGKYNRLVLDVVGGPGSACMLPAPDQVESMSVGTWLDFLDNR